MRFIVLLLVVVLLASLATYAVLNLDERVDVALPWMTLQGQPQIYLVLVALAAGMLFVGILSLLDGTRLRLANRRLRRETDRLRARLPLDDEMPLPGPTPPPPIREPIAPAPPAPSSGTPDAPADDPLPSAGRSSMTDEDPPYGV